jgi:hypothetical protein
MGTVAQAGSKGSNEVGEANKPLASNPSRGNLRVRKIIRPRTNGAKPPSTVISHAGSKFSFVAPATDCSSPTQSKADFLDIARLQEPNPLLYRCFPLTCARSQE